MKIQILSDLHIEHGNRIDEKVLPAADICVVAGDTHSRDLVGALNALASMFKHVVVIMGNHDYYGHDILGRVRFVRSLTRPNVHLLDKDTLDLDGYTFIGCTLWADFDRKDWVAMRYAEKNIFDFENIQKDGLFFTADDAYDLYISHHMFIDRSLQNVTDLSKTVVITHFLPSYACVAEKYRGDRLNPYFIGQCDRIMRQFPVPLWIFGHSHSSMDVTIYDTRVISNAVGYPRERLDSYVPNLTIEI